MLLSPGQHEIKSAGCLPPKYPSKLLHQHRVVSNKKLVSNSKNVAFNNALITRLIHGVGEARDTEKIKTKKRHVLEVDN